MFNLKQVIVVELRGIQFGFPIDQVKEIIKYITPSKMPSQVLSSEGVINLRGNLHSIIDLGSFFGMEGIKTDKNTKIIILNDNDIGLIVDDVCEIVIPKEEEVANDFNLPQFLNNRFMSYIIKMKNNLIFVLDLEKLLLCD
jgi:purine-binding chemotaxis protein CheW